MTENTAQITRNYRTNVEVETPLGRGVVQAINFHGRPLVRLALSGDPTDERCITPQARKSSLWVFDQADLKPIAARR